VAEVPHFAFPFRFGRPPAVVTEQDSIEEIAGCVLAILLCPLGFRSELPAFGIADPTFRTPVDLDPIRNAVDVWEPRAGIVLDAMGADDYDELVTRLLMQVSVRSAE
jgi:hypothetical protein